MRGPCTISTPLRRRSARAFSPSSRLSTSPATASAEGAQLNAPPSLDSGAYSCTIAALQLSVRLWQPERRMCMDFGLFVEFPRRDGMTEQEAFAECFALVDEAEALGVASVWLAVYHFADISVLSPPITVASAIAALTERSRISLA